MPWNLHTCSTKNANSVVVLKAIRDCFGCLGPQISGERKRNYKPADRKLRSVPDIRCAKFMYVKTARIIARQWSQIYMPRMATWSSSESVLYWNFYAFSRKKTLVNDTGTNDSLWPSSGSNETTGIWKHLKACIYSPVKNHGTIF